MPNRRIAIPHHAVVLVADGRKALFLRNEGDEKFLNLSTESALADDNPPTREQDADRPGRTFHRAATHRRSAVEATDWHEIAKRRFAHAVSAALERSLEAREAKAVVVVAPPRFIADLRHGLSDEARARIIVEIAKDLTGHSIADIERHLEAERMETP